MIPVLTTERLVLRPGRPDDAHALHALWSDPAVMRWLPHAAHSEVGQSEAKMASMLTAEGWRLWVVTMADDDRAIGTVSVHAHGPGVAEIGYALVRPAWGSGLAREAISAVLDRLFGDEGQRRVFAHTEPENIASNRLLERLGFVLEGILRAEWETPFGIRDACVHALLAAEWRAR